MDVRDEVVARVDRLPAEMQNQVLRFVASSAAPAPRGEPGTDLRAFSGSLDSVSAQEMIRVIEEEFEGVDGLDWQ
jgi:hypothetical protein